MIMTMVQILITNIKKKCKRTKKGYLYMRRQDTMFVHLLLLACTNFLEAEMKKKY